MSKLRTYTVVVPGSEKTATVVRRLVENSQWFTVEPMPDDDYEVTVKVENKYLLDSLTTNYRDYVASLPLVSALWWFIENRSDDDPQFNTIFFDLRGRVRTRSEGED